MPLALLFAPTLSGEIAVNILMNLSPCASIQDRNEWLTFPSILSADVTKQVPNFVSTCSSKDTKKAPLNFEPAKGSGTDFLEVGTDHQEDQVLWTTQDGKFPSGFHVGKEDEIHVNLEIVNYNKEKRDFYLTYEIEYLPGLVGHNAQEQLLNLIGCNSSQTVVLSHEGPVNTTSDQFLIYKDGHILDASKYSLQEFSTVYFRTRHKILTYYPEGHLHNGGSKMFMFINDKIVCTSEAIYGGQDPSLPSAAGASITKLTPCQVPIPVKKGDWLSMAAEYDLKNHPQ
jgi:hypothetical protein